MFWTLINCTLQENQSLSKYEHPGGDYRTTLFHHSVILIHIRQARLVNVSRNPFMGLIASRSEAAGVGASDLAQSLVPSWDKGMSTTHCFPCCVLFQNKLSDEYFIKRSCFDLMMSEGFGVFCGGSCSSFGNSADIQRVLEWYFRVARW
jgi:hypothetical protein